MHHLLRTELWGYAADEQLTGAELIAERYQGIRPAPGYGCQPDHTEKRTIFELLDVPAAAGIELTESFAMLPGSSVCGLYFAHPAARYFGVGKIGSDQLEDYAAPQGLDAVRGQALARADPRRRPGRHGADRCRRSRLNRRPRAPCGRG